MAEVLDSFEFEGPGPHKYPWTQWFDGRIWKLVQGVDWDVDETNPRSARSFRKQVHNRASTKGYIVQSQVMKPPDGPEALVIQATPK